jgi:Cyclin
MSGLTTISRNLVVDPATVAPHAGTRRPNTPTSPASREQRNASPSIHPIVNTNISSHLEVVNIPPLTALKLLCDRLNNIVKITGDIPSRSPVISLSEQGDNRVLVGNGTAPRETSEIQSFQERDRADDVTAPGTLQHNALAKRFYSKKTPPIVLEEYMQRLHRYCPMSTAVYLATSVYITRMAIIEKTIMVTPRNVHRLVLAGLRVAMKALEDLSYPHTRFARVGGVSESELTRLEIAFCFLTNFDLRVNSQVLGREVESLQQSAVLPHTDLDLNPRFLQLSVQG